MSQHIINATKHEDSGGAEAPFKASTMMRLMTVAIIKAVFNWPKWSQGRTRQSWGVLTPQQSFILQV